MRSNSARTGGNPRFWTISLLFHLAAVALLLLTPAGKKFISQSERSVRPEIVRQDKELAEVMDQIRALAIGRLKGAIGEIEAAGVVMEDRLVAEARSYETYANAQIASVSERLNLQSERLVRSQQALLEALREFARTRDAGTLKAAYRENRAAITQGQEEIRRAAQLAGATGGEIVTRQEALEDEQFAIFERITTAFEKQADHSSLTKRLAEFSREEETLKATVAQASPRMEILQPEVESAKQKRAELFQSTRKAEARARDRKIELAKAEKRGQGVEAAATSLAAANTLFETSRTELKAVDEALKKQSAELSALRKEVTAAGKRLPVLEKEIPALQVRVPEIAKEGEEGLTAALAGQMQVGKAQERLIRELQTVVNTLPPAGSETIP